MKHRIRLSLTITLVVITLAAFVYYISSHRYLLTKLSQIPLSIIIWLLLLYILWFGVLGIILYITVLICKKSLTIKENFLLNAFSTLVNFFVPGQGGIAVRGIYLKKVKNLAVRNYIFISLVYFMFYALISGVLLLYHNQQWWVTVLAGLTITLISFGIIYLYVTRSKTKLTNLDLSVKNLIYLFLATLLQSIIQIAIFGVELNAVNNSIGIHQVITYTGAANFSLFVALTPGAIGIRETFLIITKQLNGISSANIIAANIIDRSVFLIFLGILFIATLALHTKYKSFIKKSDSTMQD
jgi:uncharacterized membrane protein YbhN (UPF0104 family)